ncbi:hypothetical protein HGRIS_003510 [Hohenbuehelia grisea]|uniref:Sodium/calcium exchanger membrane region domain-containing protein n=1 Tax=Hohenbuehelia grisea TaxID=104357 RepID=A0ABR3JFP2_9AGAR
MRPIVFVGLLVWLVFLFSTLGISASDFFTPNLATIAQLLGLDENVAGVTFLAFGNGSPDVFSTFSAMRAGSGGLAIGELLGAASFIVSCVVGSMCIVRPFQVNRGPFLRDVIFFATAVTLLFIILWDNHIHLWESALLVGLYFVYVTTVVVGSWLESRREAIRLKDAKLRAEYSEEELSTPPIPYRDDPSPTSTPTQTLAVPTPRARAISSPAPPRIQTDLPPRPHSRSPSPTPRHVGQLPSFSLVGALEFREFVASMKENSSASQLDIFDKYSPITPFAGGHYHSHSHSRQHSRQTSRQPSISLSRSHSMNEETDPFDRALGLQLDERSTPQLSITLASPDETQSTPGQSNHSITGTLSSDDSDAATFVPPKSRRQRVKHVAGRAFHILFPTLHCFRSKTAVGQLASVFAAPAVLILTLTLPVVITRHESAPSSPQVPEGRLVDFEEEAVHRALLAEDRVQEDLHDLKFNKWLMAIQCVIGPLFCASVLFSTSQHLIWLLIVAVGAGLVVAALVVAFCSTGKHPSLRMARCSMGFLVAIVWIMAIADEVVNVLQTFGFIFGLSDAIIGLTIFAVGNSLADLVANMSVAVFAPIMGFSACFGGPMLNILLGVGISGSYIIQQTSTPYQLHFSTTLFVSAIGLMVLLVTTLIYVPWNNYRLTRSWGIFLVIAYFVIMTINVVVELKASG